MKIRRLICAALAASLALCPAAFAADTAPKTDRIVTNAERHRLLGVFCGAAYHPVSVQQPEL